MPAARQTFTIARCTPFLIGLILALSFAFTRAETLAAETTTPESRLIACPDCSHEVSRRAVSCPSCGCPGSAIAQAVRAEQVANRPLPVVNIQSDVGAGLGVVLSDAQTTYLLMSADLVAGASSLEVYTVGKKEPIPYTQLEIAADAPLVRLTTTSGSVSPLVFTHDPLPPTTGHLLETGEIIPHTDGQGRTSIAHLNAENQLIALIISQNGKATPHAVSDATQWLTVPPADYRAQTSLLKSAIQSAGTRSLSTAERSQLEATAWLSPFLQKSADALLHTSPTP